MSHEKTRVTRSLETSQTTAEDAKDSGSRTGLTERGGYLARSMDSSIDVHHEMNLRQAVGSDGLL